jgi:DNA-binding NtrC family response regulator
MDSKVLLIHSDTGIQNEFVKALANAGVQLISASGLDQAIEKIDHEKFEAIFFDSKTIGEYCDSLEHRIHQSRDNKQASIIVLRENDEMSVRAYPEASPDTFLIYKPFDAQQLLGILSASHANTKRVERRYERVTMRMQVHVDTQHEEFTALADSLSEGGMNLLVSGDVTLDTEWIVSFTLPGGVHLIEASGRVRRVNEANVALSFEKLHEDGRALIRSYVASKTPKNV